MTKKVFLCFILSLCFYSVFSCTTFILKKSSTLLFGRNLDWISNKGIIVQNQRNVFKESLVMAPDSSISWTSKYGSLTFNQFGKEFPFGGMNEKGLVIEIMMAPAEYEIPDNRKAINELQWIQFQLDNYTTINEVIQSQQFLRISAIAENLHYLICDSTGNAAVIEFKNHKMLSYKNDSIPIPVLENDYYSTSLSKYENQVPCRFTKTTELIKKVHTDDLTSLVQTAFYILNEVKMTGEWTIVYNIYDKKIYFKTSLTKDKMEVNLNSFNFNCDIAPKFFNLENKNKGNIDNDFVFFNNNLNKKIVKSTLAAYPLELESNFLESLLNYTDHCKCVIP